MTLSEFRTIIRLFVRGAKTSAIDDPNLDVLINAGVNDVNAYALAYKGNKQFNVSADDNTYKFSEKIDDFLLMDESGVWWNEGTEASPSWKKMDPMTRLLVDTQFPRWKDDNSDSPLRYFIEGDQLIFHPTPDSALTNGFWAFYIKKAKAMTEDTHYPFTGSTTEITTFSILDDAIVDYVRWKLAIPLGDKERGVLTEQAYRSNLNSRIILLNHRLDLSASAGNRMKAPIIN